MARIKPRKFNLYGNGGKAATTAYLDLLAYLKDVRRRIISLIQDMLNQYFDMLLQNEDMIDIDPPKNIKDDEGYEDMDDVIMIEI